VEREEEGKEDGVIFVTLKTRKSSAVFPFSFPSLRIKKCGEPPKSTAANGLPSGSGLRLTTEQGPEVGNGMPEAEVIAVAAVLLATTAAMPPVLARVFVEIGPEQTENDAPGCQGQDGNYMHPHRPTKLR